MRVKGALERDGHTLQACEVAVEVSWKESHPSCSFKPYPLSCPRKLRRTEDNTDS